MTFQIHPHPELGSEREYLTSCAGRTIELGIQLGRTLEAPLVLLLSGPLGVGKTVLVRGLVQGLGLSDREHIRSPTYTLVNTYQGRCLIHHLDLYRLESLEDFQSIGLFDYVADQAVTLIEWGERVKPWIPEGLEIIFEDLGEDERRILLRSFQCDEQEPTPQINNEP